MRETQTKPSERADRTQIDGRQIVICCDGTSNTLSAGVRDTNVVRLVEMLSDPVNRDPGGADQIIYYDPGVGVPVGLPPTGVTGVVVEPLRRSLGLALGRGIYENIGEAYLFLSREYGRYAADGEPTADQIYIFGFSRGAFTARCVAGMVSLFGLVRAEHEHLLPTLLNVYFASPNPSARVQLASWLRKRVLGRSPSLERAEIAEQIRDLFTTSAGAAAEIHFLGVWDTVQAVGIPGLRRKISSTTSLATKRIWHVRHALSIDEHRHQFLPRYFTGPLHDGQTLRQRWFRGVHSDIGGGRRTRMADATFAWMIHEAKERGLANTGAPEHRSARAQKAWPKTDRVLGDQLYATPWWSLTGMAVRDSRPAWSGEGEWIEGADPAQNPPLEHESVAVYSPPGGRRTGETRVDRLVSPWQGGIEAAYEEEKREQQPGEELIRRPRRRWWAGLIWAILGVLGTTLAGYVVDSAPSATGEFPTWTGVRLEWAQLTAFWLEGPLVDPSAGSSLIDPQWPDPGWALLASLVPLVGWSYVLARLATRWFSKIAIWRRVGGPEPDIQRVLWIGMLGFTVTAFTLGGLLSISLALVATAFDDGLARNVLLVLSGALAIIKWLGVAGTGVLGVLAAWVRWGPGLR